MSRDYSPTPYFIPPYQRFARIQDDRSECQRMAEHQGDNYEAIDGDGNTVSRWTCCDEEEITVHAEPVDEEPTRAEALQEVMGRHLADAYGGDFAAFRADVGVACANLREEVARP